MYHIPIMPREVSQFLIQNPKGLYVDATFGGGGHSLYLLENYKDIKIIAFDFDGESFENFQKNFSFFRDRIIFIRENFKNIRGALAEIDIGKVNGIFADLGVSSKQLDDLDRGFSFNSPVLDMRMDDRISLTAEKIINSYSQEDLADIFYTYGEEYRSRQIAQAIIENRIKKPIKSGAQLANIVCSAKKRESAAHPATKVFQSLRIFINDELDNLETLLKDAPSLLNKGAVLSFITFHSLEDRIVKQNFKQNFKDIIYESLNKKVMKPSPNEIKENPRARSAKLRAVKKL